MPSSDEVLQWEQTWVLDYNEVWDVSTFLSVLIAMFGPLGTTYVWGYSPDDAAFYVRTSLQVDVQEIRRRVFEMQRLVEEEDTRTGRS
ncbi:hypothetical protein F4824DRAFT_500617 [Ustulina deusta]|nr:hypothetical protein F4823DRAFT_562427 [Ustulina deusta]KAI3335749.1 hypothetical protein F4824DRAFT_500617 [Ustulina deusta]